MNRPVRLGGPQGGTMPEPLSNEPRPPRPRPSRWKGLQTLLIVVCTLIIALGLLLIAFSFATSGGSD